jgi:hypothetical protein
MVILEYQLRTTCPLSRNARSTLELSVAVCSLFMLRVAHLLRSPVWRIGKLTVSVDKSLHKHVACASPLFRLKSQDALPIILSGSKYNIIIVYPHDFHDPRWYENLEFKTFTSLRPPNALGPSTSGNARCDTNGEKYTIWELSFIQTQLT